MTTAKQNVTEIELNSQQFYVIKNKNQNKIHNSNKKIERAMIKGYLNLLTNFYNNLN